MLELGQRDVERVIDLTDVDASRCYELSPRNPNQRLFVDVGLVDDLAHQFLEDIFQSGEAIRPSELIGDDPHMDAPGLKLMEKARER